MEVRVETLPESRVVYIQHEGLLASAPKAFERLRMWVTGHRQPTEPFVAVLFADTVRDTPEGRTCRMEARVPFTKDVGDREPPLLRTGKWPVDVKEVPPARAAVTTFEGPGHELVPFVTALRRFLDEKGMRPSDEVRIEHLDAPFEAEHVRAKVHVVLASRPPEDL